MAFLRRNIEGGVVYEVDFTSLSSIADLGQGSVSIDGVTWYCWNNGGTNKAQIVNGSGIRIYGNGIAGNNQAAALLAMDIGQLFGETYSTGFELWADVACSSTPGTWAQYTSMNMGLSNVPTSDTNDNAMLPIHPTIGYNNTVGGIAVVENWRTSAATTVATDSSAPATASPLTFVLRAEGTGFEMYYGTPATPTAWPAKSGLTLVAAHTSSLSRTYGSTLYGPRFRVPIDNNEYLEVRRMRILRVWSGD